MPTGVIRNRGTDTTMATRKRGNQKPRDRHYNGHKKKGNQKPRDRHYYGHKKKNK